MGIEAGLIIVVGGISPTTYLELQGKHLSCAVSFEPPSKQPSVQCIAEEMITAREMPKLNGKAEPSYRALDKYAKRRFR